MNPASQLVFCQSMRSMMEAAHKNSVAHGFWSPDQSHVAIKIALMHEELSEALSATRHGNPPDDHIPEFSGLEAELADCIIRIADLAGKHKLRLPEAILAKMAYNSGRPVRHGKAY